jgi:hypothetical protein
MERLRRRSFQVASARPGAQDDGQSTEHRRESLGKSESPPARHDPRCEAHRGRFPVIRARFDYSPA